MPKCSTLQTAEVELEQCRSEKCFQTGPCTWFLWIERIFASPSLHLCRLPILFLVFFFELQETGGDGIVFQNHWGRRLYQRTFLWLVPLVVERQRLPGALPRLHMHLLWRYVSSLWVFVVLLERRGSCQSSLSSFPRCMCQSFGMILSVYYKPDPSALCR